MENATVPTVNIDEIAEQEVDILDAQRNRKRKRAKTRTSLDSDAGEHSGNNGDGPGANMGTGAIEGSADFENTGGGGKRLRRRPSGKETATGKVRGIGEGGGRRTLEASEWLRTYNNRLMYVTQVDDVVTYFAEGHIEAVSIARGGGLEPLLDKAMYKRNGKEVLDGTVLGKDCAPLKFQVVEVSYQFSTASQRLRVPGAKGQMVKANADVVFDHYKNVMVLTLWKISGMKQKDRQTEQLCFVIF